MSKSTKKRKRKSGETSQAETEEVIMEPIPEALQPITPEQQRINELLKQLTDASVTLVVKVAACTCRQREKCSVFLQGREMAQILAEIQDLRGGEL